MKQLLEDYQRRLKTINEMIDNKDSGSINDIQRTERFKTKAECYRTFITELEREIEQGDTEVLGVLLTAQDTLKKLNVNAVCDNTLNLVTNEINKHLSFVK